MQKNVLIIIPKHIQGLSKGVIELVLESNEKYTVYYGDDLFLNENIILN